MSNHACGYSPKSFINAVIMYDLRIISDLAQKKLIVSRQPILVNLKSNTMKNTMQIYGSFLFSQNISKKFSII